MSAMKRFIGEAFERYLDSPEFEHNFAVWQRDCQAEYNLHPHTPKSELLNVYLDTGEHMNSVGEYVRSMMESYAPS